MTEVGKNEYKYKTLVGNWNEEQYDCGFDPDRPRLLSAKEKQWQTTYNSSIGSSASISFQSALESTKKERELAAMAMQQRKIATATTQEYSMIPSRARATVAYGKAFPGHQPEVDPTQIKHVYNPFETTTRATFCNPKEQVPPKHEPQSPLEKDPNQLEAYRQRWTKSSDLTKTRMQSTEHKISFSK